MMAKSIINGKEVKGKKFSFKGPWGDRVEVELVDRSKAEEAFLTRSHSLDWVEVEYLFKNTAKIVEKQKNIFVEAIIKESGKCKGLAEEEVEAAITRMNLVHKDIEALNPEFIDGRLFGSKRKAFLMREPYGTASIITPFNYPLATGILMIVPALVAGNSVVLKPSLKTPLSSYLLVKAMLKAGFPENAIHLIIGKSSEVGDVMLKGDVIGFTGSPQVGFSLMRKAPDKKYVMELGGKGNAIVLEDADLDKASNEIINGAFKFSGQRCDALARVVVVKKVKSRLVKLLKKKASKLKFAGKKSKEGLCPLIDESAVERIKGLLEDARIKGAKFITKPEFKGRFVSPVIIDNVNPSMGVFWREVFGPVLSIITVDNEKEAINIANKNNYALDSSLFTKDLNKGFKIASQLKDGEVTINGRPSHGISMFPFGGNKLSGVGRIGIKYGVYEFSKLKTIVIG